MNNVEKTQDMVKRGLVTAVNPYYLNQERMTEQQNKSLLGQRTAFLAFSRYMYFMSDADLSLLHVNYKKEFVRQRQECPDDNFIDMALMKDAIDLQIGLRDDNQADPAICEEIAISFRQNADLAKDFPEINSDHMIELANRLISYTAFQ